MLLSFSNGLLESLELSAALADNKQAQSTRRLWQQATSNKHLLSGVIDSTLFKGSIKVVLEKVLLEITKNRKNSWNSDKKLGLF